MNTNDQPAPFGADLTAPSYLNRSTAEYDFGQARAAADLAGSMARHPAGKGLPQWRRVTRAQNVQAMWTPSGLNLAYWDHGEITTLMLDEAAQQTLRDALGGQR